jgi:tetratricopeptide (TPR) repeat protein
MKAIFQFNSKSKAKGITEAVEIAKKHGGKLEEGIYKVEFDSLEDNNLLKLQQLVGHLKHSTFFVDDKETNKSPVQDTSDIQPKQEDIAPSDVKLTWLYSDKIWKSEDSFDKQNLIRDKYEAGRRYQNRKDFEEATEDYIEVLELDHKDGYYFSEALRNLGHIYYDRKEYQEAFELFDKLFEIYPDWDISEDPGSLYLDACEKSGNKKKLEELHKKYGKGQIKEQFPKMGGVTDLVALGNYNLENIEHVSEAYNLAINSNITKFDFWINLGQSLKGFGQELEESHFYEKAIECYKKAVEAEPNFYDAILNIGSLYESLGDMDRSLEYFKMIMDQFDQEQLDKHSKIVKSDPIAFDSWQAMADIYSDYEIYSKALSCYEKAIEIDHENENLWISIGKIYIDSEDYKEAVECFKKASKINPNLTELKIIINNLRKNNIGRALEILEKLEELLYQ